MVIVHLAPDSKSGFRKTKMSYKTRKTNREIVMVKRAGRPGA
jgi:hypothetical protein